MALTRDFEKTVVARVERDLVNAALGFEQLAKLTAMPSKNLHRMLSPKGNPSMDVERCIAPLFLPIPIAVLDAHKPNSAGRAVSLQPLTHRGRFGAGVRRQFGCDAQIGAGWLASRISAGARVGVIG